MAAITCVLSVFVGFISVGEKGVFVMCKHKKNRLVTQDGL